MNVSSRLLSFSSLFFDAILQKIAPKKESCFTAQSKGQECLQKQDVTISIITQFYPPDFAATGQLIEELSKNLGEQGVNVNVFTSQPSYAYNITNAPKAERVGRVQIHRSRTAKLWPQRVRGKAVNGVLYTLRAALHLLRHVHQQHVILLTTAPPFLPVLGYFFYLIWKTPYVCLIYDIYPDIAIQLKVLSSRNWLAKFWQKVNSLVWQHANEIIVLSPAMKQRVIAQCPEISNKVAIIHSWANPDWIVPLPKHDNWFALQYDLVKPFTVLYSGNMGRCHDISTIVDAAVQLRHENIRFVFIGAGAQSEPLLQEVNTLGLDNIVFLPYQDREVLPFSLTSCDLSVVSILPEMEGLVAPSKLYSALAAGRPTAVICPSYSYLRQLIKDAGCGATFENGDSLGLADFIFCLSQDSQLVDRMGEAGRQYLQDHFTPKMIARQYLLILSMAAKGDCQHPNL